MRSWFFRLPSIALLIFMACVSSGCKRNDKYVVVYTSQDQVYAEQVFAGFTKHTGIEVRPVYDSEAVKTVAIVNRIIAEKNIPQCDVFWNNEELRTRRLEQMGLLRDDNPWHAFAFRKRQLVVRTNQLNNPEIPRTLLGLTNATLKGKVALAYPLFGTTSTHFVALRQVLGPHGWEQWCRALAANKPFLVDGNSVVVKFVARGDAWVGLTDSDDIKAGIREGLPLAAIDPSDHPFCIRNTAAVLRGAPHPREAQAFFEFLQQEIVSQVLTNAGASEGKWTQAIAKECGEPDWSELLKEQDASLATLKEIFLR